MLSWLTGILGAAWNQAPEIRKRPAPSRLPERSRKHLPGCGKWIIKGKVPRSGSVRRRRLANWSHPACKEQFPAPASLASWSTSMKSSGLGMIFQVQP